MHLDQSIIAMVHVGALPGTPANRHTMSQIIQKAIKEARIYQEAGVDAVMIENMHDRPYIKGFAAPEIVASMTAVVNAVNQFIKIPTGIQVLAGANEASLAVALATGSSFIRAEGFVYGHMADEGYIDACAGPLLRYRKQIGAENIKVFTDIKKKHSSHSITQDIDLIETARAAQFFLSDGIVITGTHTGIPPNTTDVSAVKKSVQLPVLIGSGITVDNAAAYASAADGFIIGSHFKKNGHWHNEIDLVRLNTFMQSWHKLRSSAP